MVRQDSPNCDVHINYDYCRMKVDSRCMTECNGLSYKMRITSFVCQLTEDIENTVNMLINTKLLRTKNILLVRHADAEF